MLENKIFRVENKVDIRVGVSQLRRFCESILQKIGLSQYDAFTVADSLLFCNLRGIDSHGIMRFPFYVQRLKEGGTRINPKISIIREKPASVSIDGDNGMGQVVGVFAAKLAVEKAKKAGTCFVGVRGSSHYGAASYYSVEIAKTNMIGLSVSNTGPVMAAWGGAKRIIGNNPLSIAVPHQVGKPIVLDISMSRVAGGKVRLAAKNNQKIPKGWIIDKQGKETENPHDLPEGGALLPFGEHKGYGLAFMTEIVSGALVGSDMLGMIPLWFKETKTPLNIGHCFAAIDIEGFMDLEQFKQRMDWLIKEIKSSPLSEGSHGVFIPGELELMVEDDRTKNGIPVSENVWRDLKKLGQTHGETLKPMT
jgi:LDH2 family malate/lactate/ureidoglycolate dehydrogenase